ncbi:hypothetical protein [Candidatus Nitronereus thalassa]|uniref:Uncharacterized protein n=1 Tax=Candidatus Nitronereus thalassa TaxID=3020898 RepID=A0ABU3KD43_9BACT|nr:hypothetical protein [Candidatus Nitronereus thalassa]MDT7044296.1 hypothetical protein [Candidatus Nitronereus thalassa]
MKALPLIIQKNLRDVVTLGSFSLQTFHINLSTKYVDSFQELPREAHLTLRHEFGHLLHYLTTYIGLKDLSFWVESIDVIQKKMPKKTAEQELTWKAEQILRIARTKQILSIDDEYYYEERPWEFENALLNKEIWQVKEVTGRLFRVDGSLSGHSFWATRFHVGHPDTSPSFLRIPVGMRTLLEHMAKAVDFLGEMKTQDRHSIVEKLSQQAYVPSLLHYYCLTHWLAPLLARIYGKENIDKAYLVSGHLVLLLTEIPFDDPDIWRALRSFAEIHRPDLLPHLDVPHPSFIFPIFRAALEKSSHSFNTFQTDDIEQGMKHLLKEVGLPPLNELQKHRDDLLKKILARLDTFPLGQKIKNLLEWVNNYSAELSREDRLADPLKILNGQVPVPVIFNDDYFWEGGVLQIKKVEALSHLVERQGQMLRFPHTRNLVD